LWNGARADNAGSPRSRIGDRRQTEIALDRGRRLLDSLPYPENLDNHFVVDPTKFDFYAMDCYRMLAEDKMAETSPTRSSVSAPTSTAPNGHPCASRKPASPSALLPPATATSKRQYITVNKP
jgi:hypothetical protein